MTLHFTKLKLDIGKNASATTTKKCSPTNTSLSAFVFKRKYQKQSRYRMPSDLEDYFPIRKVAFQGLC